VAALRPLGEGLALMTMYYADEILTTELPATRTVDDRELAMAGQLVEAMAGEFKPELYRDDHRERLQELIARKSNGEAVATPSSTPASGDVLDLTAALAASLTRTRRRRPEPPTRKVSAGNKAHAEARPRSPSRRKQRRGRMGVHGVKR
jgi:DNA end-binding protein Ku